jgi:hypothetical protein
MQRHTNVPNSRSASAGREHHKRAVCDACQDDAHDQCDGYDDYGNECECEECH